MGIVFFRAELDLKKYSDELFSRVYVLDWLRRRMDFPTQLRMVREQAEKWHPLMIGIETNAYQQALADHLKKTSRFPIREVKTVKDKVTRITAGLVAFERAKSCCLQPILN